MLCPLSSVRTQVLVLALNLTNPKVHVRDPPTIKLKPEDEYMKSVGEKVECIATLFSTLYKIASGNISFNKFMFTHAKKKISYPLFHDFF